MLRLDRTLRGRCLGDLLTVRKSLRRQEILLQGAIEDLRAELEAWRRHQAVQSRLGMPVGVELQRVWNELAARERELVNDSTQVRHAHYEICREIGNHLGRPRTVAG